MEEILEQNDEEDEDEAVFQASKKMDTESLYVKSPFYKDILKIIESVDVEEEISNELNQFFSSKLFNIVMKKHVPYVFLWTGLINSGKRYSYNSCEGFFGKFKKELDTKAVKIGQRPIRTTTFFEESHTRTNYK